MSRKSALQTITTSGFSHPNPFPRISPPLTREMPSTHNPYVLQDETIPGKTPYTRRHHSKSSGLGLGSARGGGKDGRSGGKNGISGGNQRQTDGDSESSSGQDDEEADDDDDEDDEDEEPAVTSPVRVNGDDIANVKLSLTSQSTITSTVDGITAKGDHRTGLESRKRSFSTAMEYEGRNDDDQDTASSVNEGDETRAQTDGDEPDYPRKRVATQLLSTNGLLTYTSPPPAVINDTNIEDNGEDDDDDGDTLITDDDFDDEDIENIEEAAIIQELQTPTKPTHVVYECEYGLENTDLITAEELEDLDNEVFNVQWHNPNLFADINLSHDYDPYSDPFAEVELEGGLFPENGSAISTPFATPTITPRGSFSTAPPSGSGSPKYSFSDSSLGDNLNSESEGDAADLNPFFERDDPVLKHIVSTQGKGGWADDTDDENGLWKHFFSEGETYGSSDEFDADSEKEVEKEEEEESDDCETDDGETTDEEENLPMPTPRSKSMLRRASISSVGSARPQVVHVDDSSSAGPTLGSWIADPTRTICVIDGAKRTFLVPGGTRGYSIGGTSDNSALSQLVMTEESESEKSSVQMVYNTTLSGLAGGGGLFLDRNDTLRPLEEAFYPLTFGGIFGLDDVGDDIGDNFVVDADDDDVDEFEQDLQITDFLDFSTDDGNDDHTGCHNNSDDDSEDGDDDEDECIPAANSSEAMLALWDHVAVTSFRKRQIQHAQSHHASSSTTANTTKDRRLSQTITPTRKKKLKQKYLAKSVAGTGLRKKITNKKNGTNFGAGSQWSPLFEDL